MWDDDADYKVCIGYLKQNGLRNERPLIFLRLFVLLLLLLLLTTATTTAATKFMS